MAKNKGHKAPLKATLQSQQHRLKQKQKVSHAAQMAEQKGKKQPGSSSKGKGKAPSVLRPTIPFRSTDNILLVGEGDFSFARALVDNPPAELQYLPAKNITATSYDQEPECYEKYPGAREVVDKLRERGVQVLFGVDATRLEKNPALKGRRWDRLVFNFPHAGR